MRKLRADIRTSPGTPILGFAVAIMAISCFIVLLWALVIAARVVLG